MPALVCVLYVFAAGSSESSKSFSIQPAPSWVDVVAVPPGVSSDFETSSGSGAICLLSDAQVRVSGTGVERYYRRVEKVLTSAGLDDVSQLELDFEPSYQRLTIHHIQIRRGDSVINALKPSEIKTVQKEEELNQRLYNGTLSAVVFLNDVRTGDVVDYDYSIQGDNPVLRGKYADEYSLTGRLPTHLLRRRVLWPSSRSLHIRNRNLDIKPSIRDQGGETEYIWQRTDIDQPQLDFDAPAWFNQASSIEVSEFGDWGELIKWEIPLFDVNKALNPALASQIQKWKELADSEQRLIAALRFVQDEVRYTGIELGPYSHMPTPPSTVFERRFGDCKDKSLLLATVLSQMGIDARPALVDTELREQIAEEQPSPYAFNHAIVRVSLNDKIYWFDPTASLQRGGLAQHYNPYFGKGLVVREGTTDLEEIPVQENHQPTTELKETYSSTGEEGAGTLEAVTTYRDSDADDIRYQLAQKGLAQFERMYLEYYSQIDSSVESLGRPEVNDDPESNVVVITERYKLPSFWKDGRREFYAGRINQDLTKASAPGRKTPLALSFPKYVTETIEAHLPRHFQIEEESKRIATESMEFNYSANSTGNTVRLTFGLRMLKDHVDVSQLAKHSQAVASIQRVLGYELHGRGSSSDESSSVEEFWPLLLVFGPFAVFGAIRFIQSRRRGVRRQSYKRSLQVSPGDSPEAAIPIDSHKELAPHLLAFNCKCGLPYRVPDGDDEHQSVLYDGRRVTVVSLKCERCTRSRDVYFTVRT